MTRSSSDSDAAIRCDADATGCDLTYIIKHDASQSTNPPSSLHRINTAPPRLQPTGMHESNRSSSLPDR
eukprot:CAMPEP_0170175490 /NCGR_PEP_ID=MMETSP0040_2-20121228/8561_1 /TAXON_ID=641309 /ORGANISM="Lotharella oceanica, Strain CCMP622" /LENGTH=68 /DNA_ID=CAMNT_0010417491 /DNA_START=16 /DNA_END=222 /DNA_ORIENTATION=-